MGWRALIDIFHGHRYIPTRDTLDECMRVQLNPIPEPPKIELSHWCKTRWNGPERRRASSSSRATGAKVLLRQSTYLCSYWNHPYVLGFLKLSLITSRNLMDPNTLGNRNWLGA